MTTRQRILNALASGPATLADIAAVITDRASVTLDGQLRNMHRDGLLRVTDWHRNIGSTGGGRPSAVWGIATGEPDRRRPIIKDAAAQAKRRHQDANQMRYAARSYKRRNGSLPPFYAMIYSPRNNAASAAEGRK